MELPGGFCVQDVIIANCLRIGVGEQREIDMLSAREVFQYRFGIVADRSQLNALSFKSGFSALQLDQLPFAVGSPVCRTEEEKNGAPSPL